MWKSESGGGEVVVKGGGGEETEEREGQIRGLQFEERRKYQEERG